MVGRWATHRCLTSFTRRTPARLPPSTPGYDAIVAAHETAIVNGEPGYLDPMTGLFVMTAAYLWSAASAATPAVATART